jgi:hypothetical protein
MVNPQKLTQQQLEALKKASENKIPGPCSLPTVDIAEIAKIAQEIKVEIKKP